MQSKKNNLRFKRIIQSVIALAMVPILYFVAVISLPYTQDFFSHATALSAELNFLEGANLINIKDSEYDLEPDFDDIHDAPFIEYEKPPQQPPSSVAQAPQSNDNQPKPANAGTVIRKTYTNSASSVYIPLGNGYIKNCTSVSAEKIKDTVKLAPKFKIKADNSPQVLIMHTHATESFQPTARDWYDKAYNSRSTDNEKNMVRVGDEIQKQLKAAGIGVIHDKTLHDYPSYNGSYERSAVTVKRILKENPSIKVVLDIHRDAIQPDANTMVAPVANINGKAAAQVMIISGCDNGKMNMPNYLENLKFSASLQRNMEKDYPTLTRPILFDYRKYNQDLTTGSILIEVGGHANSLDEAIYSGELVGKSLVKSLLSLK